MNCSFLSLKGKVALVTGGSRGIGEAIALTFADAGADIAISSRKIQDLEKVAAKIEGMGRKALAVSAHARKPEDLKSLVEQVMENFGRIDVLVNNSGTNPAMAPLIDTENDLFDQIIETNLRGYFIMCKLVGKIMKGQETGHIINISSAGGVSPSKGLAAYCMSKAGINMLTKQAALELGPYNVRVNAIAPRFVKTSFSKALWTNPELMEKETQFTPLKCVATPDEIAQAALFLASNAVNYMTGHILVMNGGAFF
ncbi:MAG: SDR family oxidoreductase [Deltaproteobacteria bacterium]|nr:SDR family oxidoreductase [Deltaproteobacteria bacterium]